MGAAGGGAAAVSVSQLAICGEASRLRPETCSAVSAVITDSAI